MNRYLPTTFYFSTLPTAIVLSIACSPFSFNSLMAQTTMAAQKAVKVEEGVEEVAEAPVEEAQATEPAADSFGDQELLKQSVKKGVAYLLQKGQAEDGSFSKQLNPAITSLCLSALLENNVPVSDARIQKGLAYVKTMVQPDGGIYAKGSTLKNYETSIAVMCFARVKKAYEATDAEKAAQYATMIAKAASFLKGLQWDDAENHGPESEFYGGQGYGGSKRPDLSNTSFFLDALKAAGEPADSEAFQKAMVFVSRSQNLQSKYNGMEYAQKATEDDKGGMIYSPVGGGETKANSGDKTANGGLRSYASMTYAGLKSFLYAGLSKDDIRVKAAMDWISRHYDLSSNPGLGQQGLYYYYHVFGKTMGAIGQDTLTDKAGTKHDWRKDLTQQLAKLQQKDGSWTNAENSRRWYEGDPNLVTAYSLLALGYADQDED
jgi:squalene-hopene/tetraprenyl-beta-curcumene cyclase